MKIISKTDDRMVLKEGANGARVLGIVIAVASVAFGAYSLASNGWSNVIWIAIILLVAGVCAFLFSSSIMLDIAKSSGQIAYQKKRVLGGSSANYAIADVLQVETRKEWQRREASNPGANFSNRNQVLVSQSVIVFKDGRQLPIDHQKSAANFSVGMGGVLMGTQIGKEEAIANQIAVFMGVPFQEIAPPAPTGINVGGIQL